MIRRLTICVILLLFVSATVAQQSDTLLLKLSKTSRDTDRINVQLQLGHYYLQKPDNQKKNLDSSLYYIESAGALSIAINATDHKYRVIIAKGELSVVKKDFDTADKLFKESAGYYHKTGNQLKEALVWHKYADVMPFDDVAHLGNRRNAYNKAYDIYKSIHNDLKAANALGGMADVDLNLGLYDKAEGELLSVIAQYKRLRYPKIYYGYYMLSETYYRMSEVQKTLMANIECVNSYENDLHHAIDEGMLYYYALATAYSQTKVYEKGIEYYKKAIDIAVKLDRKDVYYFGVEGIVKNYTHLKKYKLGLAELQKLSGRYKSKTANEESVILSSQMLLYNLLHDINDGEKLVPAYTKVNNQIYRDIEKDPDYYAIDGLIKIYDPLLQHYILSQKWEKVAEELLKLEKLPPKKLSVGFKLALYKIRFKADSATGNTLAALKKFQQIKIIEDSLTNLANSKQINELEAKYESVKKDKTIQGLNSQSAIQKSNLEKSNLQRNITFAGILVTIMLAVLLYLAYRNKKRSNFQLQVKQEQINRQNDELSALVKEEEQLLKDKDILLKQQEGLITEKEWLLREVHHRVKNNLQIVMSLLYSQAAHSQNSDAIDAIKDSQNRVQAISIIHQKLYSKGNVATILMADYVSDLVRHLCACYDCNRRRIRLKEIIDPVSLDISQAVPMGLILNEAITNAIKYAFGTDGGEITITGQKSGEDTAILQISDNGKGLPDNFNLAETSSLGMEMMKALSKQLGGSFEISGEAGVVVSIKFKIDTQLKMA